METKKRQHSPAFKTKVVLDALGEKSTLNELASKYEVHAMQIVKWKKKFLEEAPNIFSDRRRKHEKNKDELIENLYKKVGQSEMEVEWLKKKVGYSSG